MAAVANLATMQTGATAGGLADEAQTAADKAKLAYEHAQAASDAAAEAEDLTAAVEARVMAVAAMENAVKYATTASEKGSAAETAAMAELMIVGTVKTVGDADLDAEAPMSEVTSGSDEKTITGLIETPKTTGPTTNGRAADPAVLGSNPPVKYKSPMVNAAMRDDLKIGKVVDSADDMVRLQIITAYAGTQSVKVFAIDAAADWRSNKEGQIVVSSNGSAIAADGDFDADGNVVLTLRPVGMFYQAVAMSMTAPPMTAASMPWA